MNSKNILWKSIKKVPMYAFHIDHIEVIIYVILDSARGKNAYYNIRIKIVPIL